MIKTFRNNLQVLRRIVIVVGFDVLGHPRLLSLLLEICGDHLHQCSTPDILLWFSKTHICFSLILNCNLLDG